MKFDQKHAFVCAVLAVVSVPSALADPFPLVAGNCDRELPSLLSLARGDRAELSSSVKDGEVILDLKRTWANGKIESYRLRTIRSGLVDYMKEESRALERQAIKRPTMLPVEGGGMLLFPERMHSIRSGIDFIEGRKLENFPGVFGWGATYYSRDPMKSSELPDVIREVMKDACAYETKLAADTRAVKALVKHVGDWGKRTWASLAGDSKVTNQVDRKPNEKPVAIEKSRPKQREVELRSSHAAGSLTRD